MESIRFYGLVSVVGLFACTAGLDVVDRQSEPTPQNEEEGGDIASGQIDCQALSWCTTLQPASLDSPALPERVSGGLNDGLFRLEEGGFQAFAYLFQNGQYIEMSADFSNRFGTFDLFGNTIRFDRESECSGDDQFELPQIQSQEVEVRANGDELYFVGSCDGSDECGFNQRYVRVSNLCSASSSFDCPTQPCECDVVENTIPVLSFDGDLKCDIE